MSSVRSFLMLLTQILTGILLAVSGSLALAQEATPQPNPFCEGLAPDLVRAAEEWRQPIIEGNKVLDRPEGDADVPAGTKLRITLIPSDKVTLIKLPRVPDVRVPFFSGFVTFRTGKAGSYRVLLNQYLWLEMIDLSGKLANLGVRAGVLDSNRRLNGCLGIGKNLSFQLEADTRYWLQMSGAKNGAVTELVISAPD